MSDTLVRMPKRRKSKSESQSQNTPGTEVVRIDADLVRKMRVIAIAEERSVSNILSERLRPYIDSEYPKALKKLAEREQ